MNELQASKQITQLYVMETFEPIMDLCCPWDLEIWKQWPWDLKLPQTGRRVKGKILNHHVGRLVCFHRFSK